MFRLILRCCSSVLIVQLGFVFPSAQSLPFVSTTSGSSSFSLTTTSPSSSNSFWNTRGGVIETDDNIAVKVEETEEKEEKAQPKYQYGRISDDEFRLTPEQIETFHRDGCVTIPNVLTEEEVAALEVVFDKFLNREIDVSDKDFCDMSKPFGVPPEEWSIVNCMLPTRYYPEWQNNLYERLTRSMAQQLFNHDNNNDTIVMVKDYDQLLTKLPGKLDAVFAWHQDIAYWPGPAALGNANMTTATCTFSLAIDDSTEETGCLRYVVGSSTSTNSTLDTRKTLRPHRPLCGTSRDEGHALVVDDLDESKEIIRLAPAARGSVTIHDEYVVHGSSGNAHPTSKRRTYVLAYRAKDIVEAERRIGFTHSHNDQVNWDTFQDGESHRVKHHQKKSNTG